MTIDLTLTLTLTITVTTTTAATSVTLTTTITIISVIIAITVFVTVVIIILMLAPRLAAFASDARISSQLQQAEHGRNLSAYCGGLKGALKAAMVWGIGLLQPTGRES